MLKLRVTALCKLRLIAHPYTALTDAGISKTKAMQYLSGKTNRLMIDDTEILCTLLRCTPNDLLEWTPKSKAEDYPENPLQALRKKPLFNMADMLSGMTIGEMEAMVELKKKQEEEDKKK